MDEGDQSSRVRLASAELTGVAQRLRSNMTPAEQALWNALSNRQLRGLRFRAQHPVETFILDFYCPACKLVVEVDGDVHDQEQIVQHDKARAEHLEARGYRVLRFRNDEVLTDLPSVLQRIATAAVPLQRAAMTSGDGQAD